MGPIPDRMRSLGVLKAPRIISCVANATELSVILTYARRIKVPLRPSLVSTLTACASTEIIYLTVASVQIRDCFGLSLRFADALVVRGPVSWISRDCSPLVLAVLNGD